MDHPTGPAPRQQRGLRFEPWMRLVRSGDFERTFATGVRVRGEDLVLVAAPGLLSGATRLGISIGKRMWSLAVKRNRQRRLMREAFRLTYAALPRGLDVIAMLARPKLDLDLNRSRDELVQLLRKAEQRIQNPRRSGPR